MENTKCKAHLTADYLMKAADECIARLKVQLGQANAYIEELESEETVARLLQENKDLKKEIARLNHLLSSEGIDDRIASRNKTIKDLNKRIKLLEDANTNLIQQLNDKRNS